MTLVRRTFPRKTAIALAALSLSACVQLTDFNPVGTAASISGRWTIDGNTPAGASCGLLGASRVRVTFLDQLRPVPHSGLFFQCDAERAVGGGEPGFDTRDGSGAVVAAGCWRLRLTALDDSGNVVAVGPISEFLVPGEDVAEGCTGAPVTGHIEIPPADFLSATIVAMTTLDGGRAGEASCAEAGISDVRWVFDDLGGGRVDALGEQGLTQVTQPCAFGIVAGRALPGFTYTAHLETVDEAGGVRVGPAQTFTVGAGDVCYGGASCRAPCREDRDCAEGGADLRCRDERCRLDSDPSEPTVALDAL
ncbi:MAG: hypothetical protein AB7S26_11125 [Sandaracinaceae bacterium]